MQTITTALRTVAAMAMIQAARVFAESAADKVCH
jgi:hypothetical protein